MMEGIVEGGKEKRRWGREDEEGKMMEDSGGRQEKVALALVTSYEHAKKKL